MGEDETFLDADLAAPVDREIIEENLLVYVDEYAEIKDLQAGKPYYIPRKSALLLYADDLYYEKTKEFIELRDFLCDQMECDNADELADRLHLFASIGETYMQCILKDMARMGF
jgi:hypothetical protein